MLSQRVTIACVNEEREAKNIGVSKQVADISEYRIRRKRAGSARWILMFVFLVVCLSAGYFFARSGFFTISSIEVKGNETVSADRICSLSGFVTGENLFSVSKDDAELWLKIEPCIKEAKVKRCWPNRVEIMVIERQAVAQCSLETAIIEIDASGRVLRRYSTVERMDLPLVSGVDLHGSGTVPGSILDTENIRDALDVLTQIPEDAGNIGEINVADPQDIKIYTIEGVEIRIGDSNDFAEKYLLYTNILKDLDKNSQRIVQYIDVSIIDKPVIH